MNTKYIIVSTVPGCAARGLLVSRIGEMTLTDIERATQFDNVDDASEASIIAVSRRVLDYNNSYIIERYSDTYCRMVDEEKIAVALSA